MHIDTIFDIASLTKVIATTSLMLCAHHEGVARLDDRLDHFDWGVELLPELGGVTLRQLLTHTSGFEAWQPFYETLLPDSPDAPDTTADARRNQVVQCILPQPLVAPPGTQVRYSDLGFILLGCLLERQYGQLLSTLFLDKVAQPLGLDSITYRLIGGPSSLSKRLDAYAATEVCNWRGRVLVGEVHDENAWAMGGVAGHAGLFATAKAVWQFAQTLLDTTDGRRVWLPPELLRQSWKRQTFTCREYASHRLGYPQCGGIDCWRLCFATRHRALGVYRHQSMDGSGARCNRGPVHQPGSSEPRGYWHSAIAARSAQLKLCRN